MASWAKDRPSAIAATSVKPFSCQKALNCVPGTVQASHMPKSLGIPSSIKANQFRRMLSSAAAKAFRAVPGQKWHCYFLTKTTGSAPMPIAANWKGCPSCEPRLRKRLHRRCPRRHRLDFRPCCHRPLGLHRPGVHASPSTAHPHTSPPPASFHCLDGCRQGYPHTGPAPAIPPPGGRSARLISPGKPAPLAGELAHREYP